ncbi:MAG: HD domain-containing protein [Patescibacteria group bacterium]
MGKSERPELPFHEDFYYPFEYELSEFAKRFKSALGKANFQEEDKKRIQFAWVQACLFHKGQTRKEKNSKGERLPYVIHPLEVALSVLEMGGGPAAVMAALLHDVREDDKWVKRRKRDELVQLFRGRVVEVLTRLVSKYRLSPKGRVIKLSPCRYFEKLNQEPEAVFIKTIDRLKNLMSCGRILDQASKASADELATAVDFVRKQIQETDQFVIPLAENHYAKLARKLKILNFKLETRLQVVEVFLLQNETRNLQDPLLPSDAVCDPGC